MRLNHFQSLHALLLLIATVAAAFWCMDELTAPPVIVLAADAEPQPPRHAGTPRMFVFLVDSLRYETAAEGEIMPYLASMAARGVSARVETVHDAVSVPALRAAFTGTDRVAVFGFVKNLWHGSEAFESMFTRARVAERSILVCSDGSFMQFGDDLPERRSVPIGTRGQVRVFDRAVEDFLAGTYDLVVVHVTFADAVTHRSGVDAQAYREAFGIVDGMIESLDERIPPDESLVIFGDHGHDETGRHLMGMDVPSYGVFRGAAYAPGVDLGTIPIRDLRYLLSFGLELPLPPGNAIGRYPSALVADGPLPPEYADDGAGTAGGEIAPGRFALVMLALSLIATIWVTMLRAPCGPLSPAAAWIALVLVAVPAWWPAGPALAAAIAAAGLAWAWQRSGRGWRPLERIAGPVLLAQAMVAWGKVLWMILPWAHWPRFLRLAIYWALAIVAGGLLVLRLRAMTVAWALLAVALGLMYPTVYHYGAPAAVVPLWFALLLYMLIEDGRRGVLGRPALLALPVVALIAPFAFSYAENFQFLRWYGPISGWLWDDAPRAGLALAFAAKLVVFTPRRPTVLTGVAALLAAAGLQFVQLRWTQLMPVDSPRWTFLAVIGAVGLASGWAARGEGPRRDLARIGSVLGLALLYCYTVRVPAASYLWADCLFAAMVLTARFVAGDARRGVERRSAYPFLLILGVLVTGWVTLTWSFHRLEWGFLFDWFEVRVVERNAGALCGLIAFRYALPLVIIRVLLRRELPADWPYPQRVVTLVAGSLLLASCFVACGIGFLRADTDVYLEAVQQTGIWGFVMVALPWMNASRSPRPAPPGH